MVLPFHIEQIGIHGNWLPQNYAFNSNSGAIAMGPHWSFESKHSLLLANWFDSFVTEILNTFFFLNMKFEIL